MIKKKRRILIFVGQKNAGGIISFHIILQKDQTSFCCFQFMGRFLACWLLSLHFYIKQGLL